MATSPRPGGDHAIRAARLFDRLVASYDELEPWYEHLYAVLDEILLSQLAPPADGQRRNALDVGCGTGFQAALLEKLGYDCHGLDVSAGLLAVAARRLPASRFTRASAEALPYRSGSFDVACCCGSTLSFLEHPDVAVSELARVLRPGGTLLLECEHKWNLDLGWSLLSSLTGDWLGYHLTPRDVWRQLRGPLAEGFIVEYPCRLDGGGAGSMTLRLFTRSELGGMLGEAGLRIVRVWGIHSVTNLIPSTTLHRTTLPTPLASLYRRLRALDRVVAGRWPARAFANSVVILTVKPSPTTSR